MKELAAVLFWGGLAVAVYAYFGYPLLVLVVGRLRDRSVRTRPLLPQVSLIIAAHNEEAVIEERLRNALAFDYPSDRLQIVVASDGSTDRTETLARRYEDRGVHVVSLPRIGKVRALDAAVRRATGEILVFSDANTLAEPAALGALVRNFADPRVGGVAGHTLYRCDASSESAGLGERLYWRYDTWLKRLESRTGSVLSAHGGLYAIRRRLYSSPPDGGVTDDFYISTGVVEAGYRLVFEPDARAYERPVAGSGGEFGRRIRLTTRGIRSLALRAGLLAPGRYGFYSVALASRKVLRRIVPVFLLGLLPSSAVLASSGAVYALALGTQVGFYALALAGGLLRSRPAGRWKALYVPFFFCLANAASIVAVARFLRGDRIEMWVPQRHANQRQG